MDQEYTETNVFEVKLPKPGPRGLIIRIAAIVLGVGIVAVAVGLIVNRAAAPTADPLAQVMPIDTLLFVSMTTHADQQTNYAVVVDAWKESKEAKQIASALQLAANSSGLDWETDIQPWLGDRVGMGLIDMGGFNDPVASTMSSATFPRFHAPFFVIAIHTRDRAKSDKFLAGFQQQLATTPVDGYYTSTLHTDNYRGIPIAYQTSESKTYDSVSSADDGQAFATVNDVVVFTVGSDNLKKVIDAALDGRNLAVSNNYKTTMAALPAQNVGSLYLDLNIFIAAEAESIENTAALNDAFSPSFDSLYDSVYSNTTATPADRQKRIDDAKKAVEATRLRQQQSVQQMQETFRALGGLGLAMTYEPSGLRFDMATQFDPSKLPDKWRGLYPTAYTAASNQMFDNLPASAIMAINGNVPNSTWQLLLNPDYLSANLASNLIFAGSDFKQQLADFQKATGLDLKADLVDLFSGNVGLFMLPKTTTAAPNTNAYAFNFPFELGAMLDASDATRVSRSIDKIFNAIVTIFNKSGMQLQPLNRAPYSTLLDKQNNMMLAYGPINQRLVIGSTPDTLDAIANTNQTPLSADPTFKEATAVLPPDRISTGYFNLSSLWKWLALLSGGSNCGDCNYLSAFKWISFGSQAPANGIAKGSMHIGLQPAKQNVLSQ
jgi:hypothetical protein